MVRSVENISDSDEQEWEEAGMIVVVLRVKQTNAVTSSKKNASVGRPQGLNRRLNPVDWVMGFSAVC
jgi:hypothetical protein